MNLGEEYLSNAIRRFRYYKDLGDKTLAQVSETDLHFRSNETCNSIAIIVQHMTGNMLSRWTHFLTEDGEKEWRQRDEEFEAHALNKQALMELWEKGWTCLFDALETLTDEDLLKTVFIRQEPLTVIDAINRQLAHYPYHVGQLVYIGKLLKHEQWKNLSIPKGQSHQYNQVEKIKDPAKKF